METMIIFDALLKILLSGLMGSICGLFIYFVDYTFWKGAIFDFYLPWLAKLLLKYFSPKELKKLMALKSTMSNDDFDDILKDKATEEVFFYKMLGGCPICFGMWIAMASYAIICYFTFLEWYFCFPYMFVSSWQIRKLVKATY